MTPRLLLPVALLAVISCASAGAPPLEVGPGKIPRDRSAYPDIFRVARSYETFGVSRPLRPGEVLRLQVSDLSVTRRLRAARCGDPVCQAQEPAGIWDASSLPTSGEVELTIETPGWYHFWIEDSLGPGEQFAEEAFAESVSWHDQTLTLRYDGGPTVIAQPVQRGAGVPAPAAVAADSSPEAVARLCRTALESGRFEVAIPAARRWIELARTPAERAGAYHRLGLALVQHALDELYPSTGVTTHLVRPPGWPRRQADPILGTDRLRAAAAAFRHAAAESRDPEVLLDLADTLVRLEEYAEASEVLERYAAAGGADAAAEDLRCWVEFAAAHGGELASARRPNHAATAPIKIHAKPVPGYTEAAREQRVMGSMVVMVIIDEKGRVACARPATRLPAGLTEAAVDAVEHWRFAPATLDGEPVPFLWDLTVNFTLQ